MIGHGHYFIQLLLTKFYAGLKFYVDYQNGSAINDGLSPSTPVDTVTTAINKAASFPRMPKVIFVMQGPVGKKSVIDEQIVINVPWTLIDFGLVSLASSSVGIMVNISADFSGVMNANIDGVNQPVDSSNVGVRLETIGGIVVGSVIQRLSGIAIQETSGFGLFNMVIGNIIYANNIGIQTEAGAAYYLNNLIWNNSLAIKMLGGSNASFISRNIIWGNTVDTEENQYIYTGNDGVGSLNKLTSASADWTPGEHTGRMLIDSDGIKPYKILSNTVTELTITDVDLNGEAKDVTPANGVFYIVDVFDDVVFYENYWDKLALASLDVYGDVNRDGVLDKVIQVPAFGIGSGKSTVIDERPLTRMTIQVGSTAVDFNNLGLSQLVNLNIREFIKATVDIPSRNIKAGMLESIIRKINTNNITEEYTYDAARDVIKTEIKK